MGSKNKAATMVTADLQLQSKTRATAWDSVARGELAFDFRPPDPGEGTDLRAWGSREKVGVKEAIIRWLDEQL